MIVIWILEFLKLFFEQFHIYLNVRQEEIKSNSQADSNPGNLGIALNNFNTGETYNQHKHTQKIKNMGKFK